MARGLATVLAHPVRLLEHLGDAPLRSALAAGYAYVRAYVKAAPQWWPRDAIAAVAQSSEASASPQRGTRPARRPRGGTRRPTAPCWA